MRTVRQVSSPSILFDRRSTWRILAAILDKQNIALDTNILPETVDSSATTTIGCHQGLYETNQIERVLACGFKNTLANEIDKLDAHCFIERPRTCYTLRDVVIAGGWIYPEQGRLFMGDSSPLRALTQKIRLYERATLLNSSQGLKYFGHWL